MLTAQGPFISMKTGAAEWAIAAVVGLLLYAVLAVSLVLAVWPGRPVNEPRQATATTLGLGLLGVEQATPEHKVTGMPPGVTPPPRTRMSYLLPFEIVSVHLLIVLIGAAYLARAKRRRGATP
jgi:NADH-quinone oxidoreductase subunit J